MIQRRERRLAHGNLHHLLIRPAPSNLQRRARVSLRDCAILDGMVVMVGFGHATVLMLMAVLALAIVALAMTSIKR